MQALERAAETLPLRPGLIERREFEFIRHGTLTLIAAFDVVTGKIAYHLGPTRTEQEFCSGWANCSRNAVLGAYSRRSLPPIPAKYATPRTGGRSDTDAG